MPDPKKSAKLDGRAWIEAAKRMADNERKRRR